MKSLVKFGYFFYFLWHRIYQFFERLWWRKDYKKIKNSIISDFNEIRKLEISPMEKWKMVMEKYNFKWRKDTWYMLGDVISDPYIALHKGGDDCDGHANIGFEFFGEYINWNGKIYKGCYWAYANKKLKGGHMVGVWKAKDGTCLLLSNGTMEEKESEQAIMKWFKDVYKYELGILVKFSKDKKVLSVIT